MEWACADVLLVMLIVPRPPAERHPLLFAQGDECVFTAQLRSVSAMLHTCGLCDYVCREHQHGSSRAGIPILRTLGAKTETRATLQMNAVIYRLSDFSASRL